MDPISAFSLATNVLTVVEAAIKLSVEVKEICDSATGALREHTTLNDVTLRLDSVYTKLENDTKSRGHLSREDQELQQLTGKCQDSIGRLQVVLGKLRATRRREVLWVVLAARARRKEVAEIRSELDLYSTVLNTRILVDIRARCERSGHLIETIPAEVGGVIRSHLGDLSSDLNSRLAMVNDNVLALRGRLLDVPSTPISNQEDWKAVRNSLFYPEITRRQETIDPAHRDTFKWIFDDSRHANGRWDSFSNWLTTADSIYWINGKPGAGKSTLMKYITSHPQTPKCLDTWAGGKKLITVEHFFWYAGAALEKSQRGLHRSIMYQMLQQKTEFARHITSTHMLEHVRCLDTSSARDAYWSQEKLAKALSNILAAEVDNVKVCVFIDGLDEVAEQPHDLVKQIRELESLPHLKLCVASRPWTQFSEAFQNCAQLRVQDLTSNDVQIYVSSQLKAKVHEQSAASMSDASRLVQTVVDKANGVFIWVKLVVRMLFRSIENSDGYETLLATVDSLPIELDELYSRMALNIPSKYRGEVKRIFRFLTHPVTKGQYPLIYCTTNLSVGLHISSEDLVSGRFYISQDMSPGSLRRRLLSICGGFVQVEPSDSSQTEGPVVEYVHKSAEDWLLQQSDWDVRPRNTGLVDIVGSFVLSLRYWVLKHRNGSRDDRPDIGDKFLPDRCVHWFAKLELTGILHKPLILELVAAVNSAHGVDLLAFWAVEQTSPELWPGVLDQSSSSDDRVHYIFSALVMLRAYSYAEMVLRAYPIYTPHRCMKVFKAILPYLGRADIGLLCEVLIEMSDCTDARIEVAWGAFRYKCSVFQSFLQMFLTACYEMSIDPESIKWHEIYRTSIRIMKCLIDNGADINQSIIQAVYHYPGMSELAMLELRISMTGELTSNIRHLLYQALYPLDLARTMKQIRPDSDWRCGWDELIELLQRKGAKDLPGPLFAVAHEDDIAGQGVRQPEFSVGVMQFFQITEDQIATAKRSAADRERTQAEAKLAAQAATESPHEDSVDATPLAELSQEAALSNTPAETSGS